MEPSALDALSLQDKSLTAIVQPLLEDELYWFPVRHHSPASAHFLINAIKLRKPKCILLEAPAHLQHLLPFLWEKTEPPIALYSNLRLEEINTPYKSGVSWFPLLEYSPEWQAIQWAKKMDAELIFIDLPHFCQPEDNDTSSEGIFFKAVADKAGFLNWHECWDSLFESAFFTEKNTQAHAPEHDVFRQQLLYFAAAARTLSDSDESPNMQAREHFMWGKVQETLARYSTNDVMVVCGALHAFMKKDAAHFSTTQYHINDIDQVATLNTSVVPFSFKRTAAQQGYAAGNRAPWFYQQQWNNRNKKNPDITLVEHIQRIIAHARKLGESVSAADTLSVAHHARLLAQLRSRQVLPVLDDIEDAVWACCCKGNPAEHGAKLTQAINWANIGSRLGKVNPAIGQLPLVQDFYQQLEHLNIVLPQQDKQHQLKLDLREKEDQERAYFLHRLLFLKLPCVTHKSRRRLQKTQIFQENWSLNSVLGSEERLIDLSEFGDAINTIVQIKIQQALEKHVLQIDRFSAVLVSSQTMGLGAFNGDIPELCQNALQHNGRFIELTQAFKHFVEIEQNQTFMNCLEPHTKPIVAECFLRATLALSNIGEVPQEEQHLFIEGLHLLAAEHSSLETLYSHRELLTDVLQNVADGNASPLVSGACFGLLLESKKANIDDFSDRMLAFTKDTTGDAMINAASWLEGVMLMSKVSILAGADAVTRAIDQLLQYASWEDFLLMLPRMRAGFESIGSVQKSTIAMKVAQLHGLASSTELEFPRMQGNALNLMHLDETIEATMKTWRLCSS